MAESYEEWRVLANVQAGEAVLDRVIEDVRARTEEDVDVHRRGRHGIAVYAFTEDAVRRAEQALAAVLRRDGLKAETSLTGGIQVLSGGRIRPFQSSPPARRSRRTGSNSVNLHGKFA